MTQLWYRLPGESESYVFQEGGSQGHRARIYLQAFDPRTELEARMGTISIGAHPEHSSLNSFFKSSSSAQTTAEADFCAWVEDATRSFKEGEFNKVVLSRSFLQSVPPDFHPGKLFHVLCEAYPSAFVYLLTDPIHGTWMGASPELLLRAGRGEVRTMSLAGTRPLHGSQSFGLKERTEQGLVTGFITEKFIEAGMRNLRIEGPSLLQAGHLLHLHTRFTAEMPDGYEPLLLAKTLHPTPAVGGAPRHKALQFIDRHETHDRRMYAGFIGIAMEESGHETYFVNLRCLEWVEAGLLLYAGAGINPGSIPSAEWDETGLKLQTLRKFLDASS
jgi:isochorismate synthase